MNLSESAHNNGSNVKTSNSMCVLAIKRNNDEDDSAFGVLKKREV